MLIGADSIPVKNAALGGGSKTRLDELIWPDLEATSLSTKL